MLLLSFGADAQVTRPDSLPEAKIIKQVADTLRPILKEVVRPDELAKLQNAEDSIPVTIITKPGGPIPKKSAIYSLILPSLGQIYNRDYWKLPFVYAGLGAAVYTIHWNTLRYNDYLKPYLSSIDPETGKRVMIKDPDTGKLVVKEKFDVYVRKDDRIAQASVDQLKRGKTFYRRYRGYGFVILGLTYALTAVEANVAAHLKNFNANMNEDLTIRFEPSNERTFFSQSAPGMKLVLAF